MSESVPFPCWIAFRADGFPVAFADARYCSPLQMAEEDGPHSTWATHEVRLITDQAERDRYLDMHSSPDVPQASATTGSAPVGHPTPSRTAPEVESGAENADRERRTG